jgi:2-dehydro-3-deoxy-D-arabinonate dehydratase
MADPEFLIRYRDQLFLESNGGIYPLQGNAASLDWVLENIRAADLLPVLKSMAGKSSVTLARPFDAPVENQEVWAAGVTYQISTEARERESGNSNVYMRVYDAPRPELFFKACGADVVGSGAGAGIRQDSDWNVPEPELAVILNRHMEVIGFTIGNDMSSRSIEGANPLYLPQAKVYQASCVLGPRIWLTPSTGEFPEVSIRISITRQGAMVFEGNTSTRKLNRTLPDLLEYLGRAKDFPRGVVLLTGTGVVPPDDFTLNAGDEVSIQIDPIGSLVNPVIQVGRSM